ncbi:hypothetical protein [Terrabacter sp. BE26]|uniref:hypothetical protein n=1 Tax=Terrabacter sp. BE26 TaxID=2898152 RepID=UPI0035BE4A98
MKAIVQDRYGGAGVLSFADVPRPQVGEDQVLVQVVAAGVDRGTLHLVTGQPYLMRVGGVGFRAPKRRVPGVDFTVARAGQMPVKPTQLTSEEAAVRGTEPSTASAPDRPR